MIAATNDLLTLTCLWLILVNNSTLWKQMKIENAMHAMSSFCWSSNGAIVGNPWSCTGIVSIPRVASVGRAITSWHRSRKATCLYKLQMSPYGNKKKLWTSFLQFLRLKWAHSPAPSLRLSAEMLSSSSKSFASLGQPSCCKFSRHNFLKVPSWDDSMHRDEGRLLFAHFCFKTSAGISLAHANNFGSSTSFDTTWPTLHRDSKEHVGTSYKPPWAIWTAENQSRWWCHTWCSHLTRNQRFAQLSFWIVEV